MNSWTGRGAATRIYAPDFDEESARLPTKVRNQIEQKLNEMGMRLSEFPHHRLTGSSDCRLRIGDYRVLYQFDVPKNLIFILTVGHRREIYR